MKSSPNTEHEHVWAQFPGGRGCTDCPAWVHDRRAITLIDALPTSLITQPPRPAYVDAVGDNDLSLDVMTDLLPIAREGISWAELEQVATVVIERVRNQS